jgi:hypothetical protein
MNELEFIKWQYLLPHRSDLTLHLVHSKQEFKNLLEIITYIDPPLLFRQYVFESLNIFKLEQWNLLDIDDHNQMLLEEAFGTFAR